LALLDIAVVDDDLPVRRALARLLAAAGFSVITFGSAEEFLAGADQSDFSCLLLDAHLPGMGGLDLLAAVRASGWDLPVIFITADCQLATSATMTQTGRPCLVKPCDEHTLLTTIGRLTAG
jgi:FixJ family two-component response regulator